VGGKIYVLGGMARDFPIDPAQGHFDFPWHAVGNTYVYDPRADTWSELAPMPAGTERAAGAIAARHGKIYVVGGTFCHEGQNGECFTDRGRNRLFTAYDTKTDTWQRLPDLPQPRDHMAGAFFGSRLYVFGGRYDTLDPSAQFDDVFVYDVRKGRWSEAAPMPTARSEAWLGVARREAHLMGGSGNPAPGTDGTFANHEAYDLARNRWRILPPMPEPRHGPVTAVVGNTIYLPGGSTSQTVGVTPTFDTFRPGERHR
jgi:N-acetylneuraminic acid mutarotase